MTMHLGKPPPSESTSLNAWWPDCGFVALSKHYSRALNPTRNRQNSSEQTWVPGTLPDRRAISRAIFDTKLECRRYRQSKQPCFPNDMGTGRSREAERCRNWIFDNVPATPYCIEIERVSGARQICAEEFVNEAGCLHKLHRQKQCRHCLSLLPKKTLFTYPRPATSNPPANTWPGPSPVHPAADEKTTLRLARPYHCVN